MGDDKLRRWQGDIRRVTFEVRELHDFRRDSRVFWWAAQQYDELFEEGGLFTGFIYLGRTGLLAHGHPSPGQATRSGNIARRLVEYRRARLSIRKGVLSSTSK